jgi:Protein of unknown function (DUF3768)
MDSKTARIRALNDELRQNFAQGMAVMTPGIAALGAEEHDFGSFEADGHMIYFKIDYFDHDLSMHSPDPADPSVNKRVITIMLAEEY